MCQPPRYVRNDARRVVVHFLIVRHPLSSSSPIPPVYSSLHSKWEIFVISRGRECSKVFSRATTHRSEGLIPKVGDREVPGILSAFSNKITSTLILER